MSPRESTSSDAACKRIEERAGRGDFDAALRPESTEQALREGPRQYFALASEVARGVFEPSERWNEFVHALWEQIDAGFGLTSDDQEHTHVPLAWFDHSDDPDVVVWDPEPDEAPR